MPNRLRAWQAVADEYGTGVSVETGANSSEYTMVIERPFTKLVVQGRSYPYHYESNVVRARALAAGTEGLRFDLDTDRPNLWATLLRLVEVKDTGYAPFDSTFRVVASDRGWARTWLSETVQNTLLSLPKARVRVARGRVELTHKGHDDLPSETLRNIITIVDGLSSATRAQQIGESWEHVASALDGRTEDLPASVAAVGFGRIGGSSKERRKRPIFDLRWPTTIAIDRSPLRFSLSAGLAPLGRRRRRSYWTTLTTSRLSRTTGEFVYAGGDITEREWAQVGALREASGGARVGGKPREFVDACLKEIEPTLVDLSTRAVIRLHQKTEVRWLGLETRPEVIEAGIAAASRICGLGGKNRGPYR